MANKLFLWFGQDLKNLLTFYNGIISFSTLSRVEHIQHIYVLGNIYLFYVEVDSNIHRHFLTSEMVLPLMLNLPVDWLLKGTRRCWVHVIQIVIYKPKEQSDHMKHRTIFSIPTNEDNINQFTIYILYGENIRLERGAV
jgi:hypothetical protein